MHAESAPICWCSAYAVNVADKSLTFKTSLGGVTGCHYYILTSLKLLMSTTIP